MWDNAIHYQASNEPLGKVKKFKKFSMTYKKSCLHVSGGHEKFEYVAGTSWPMIKKVFERPPKPYIQTYDEREPSPPRTEEQK